MAPDPVFHALADPTRRRIVELVLGRERSAGELASEFDVARPTVSRHLRVLREAGLLVCREDAQRRLYRFEPTALEEVTEWLERARHEWATRLDALERHLDDEGTP